MSQKLSRRELLKLLGAATGAAALSSLPNQWVTPIVEIGALPAHAQGSNTATVSGYVYGCRVVSSPGAPQVIRSKPSNAGCTPPLNGAPVQGAIVGVVNSSISTSTDQAGHFSLLVPAGNPCIEAAAGGLKASICPSISAGDSICLNFIFGCFA